MLARRTTIDDARVWRAVVACAGSSALRVRATALSILDVPGVSWANGGKLDAVKVEIVAALRRIRDHDPNTVPARGGRPTYYPQRQDAQRILKQLGERYGRTRGLPRVRRGWDGVTPPPRSAPSRR